MTRPAVRASPEPSSVVSAELLYVVRVRDRVDEQIAGHRGCAYASPPQPHDAAVALVALLLGGATRPPTGARSWTRAVPGGAHPLRAALWEFARPMLSPRLVELHRDAFVLEEAQQSTVDLAAHRGDSSLDEFDIGQEDADAA